jgi:asparagine synthase (glutamine-hydrolysing)
LEFCQWDPLSRAQYLESRYLLPGYILASQGDRMAMAHSVEARHPLLDHRVVEFAASLPPTMRIKVLQEKYLLKRVARRLLPEQIVHRPKQPFRSPDGQSFFAGAAEDYVLDVLSPDALRKTNLFNPEKVAVLVNKFRSGRETSTRDNMALVGILSTQLLARSLGRSPADRFPIRVLAEHRLATAAHDR